MTDRRPKARQETRIRRWRGLDQVDTPARAVRLVREGENSVVLPLVPGREYQLGRSERADLYFGDQSVSRLHGGLYFSPEASAWTFKDAGSANGSFLSGSGASTEPARRLKAGKLVAIGAGDVLQLGNSKASRLEFLADVPADALGVASSSSKWASAVGRKLEAQVQLAARHSLPLFLLGASGTGKTWVARRIHELGRHSGPYVDMNCGHLPTDRTHLASELLGHVKGAFTGADEVRHGKLFEADGGTLFLDEVESLVPEAQVFLLDLLEGKGQLRPLGASPSSSKRPRPKFRIISASKKRLEESELRRDLAQRLAGEIILVPGLAERREDIPAFIDVALEELAAEQQLHAGLTPDALAWLQEQRWPGEVRELLATVRAVAHRRWAEQARDGLEAPGRQLTLGRPEFEAYLAERRAAFGGVQVPLGDVGLGGMRTGSNPVLEGEPLRKRPGDLTREDVEGALRDAAGNKTRAARALGVAFNTLKTRMAELGVTSD